MPSPTLRCPQCGAPAEAGTGNPQRPFCSKRCKLIDLGAWFDERNAIAGRAENPPWPNAEAADDDPADDES